MVRWERTLRTTKVVYAEEGATVAVKNNATWQDIFINLLMGNEVIVDILATESYLPPEYSQIAGKPALSGESNTFAHFTQVVGMDYIKEEIYLADSISEGSVRNNWTVSFSDLASITNQPEIRADSGPSIEGRESTNYWLLIIDRTP
jgi:hypothetical protein